jgi:hypothetical protein
MLGSLVTVMATSLRRGMTVILSFVIFNDKKFTPWHRWVILLLATGTGMDVYLQTEKKREGLPEKAGNLWSFRFNFLVTGL